MLDVATGTGAVARELVRQKGCSVVGVDQSAEMLAEGRRRLALAAATRKVRLRKATRADLPFEDGQFDALTFTYLLRYVDDPPATLRELARVVRPGGTIAGLEFGVPTRRLAAAVGAWTRVGAAGRGARDRRAAGTRSARSSARRSGLLRSSGRCRACSRRGATRASRTCRRGGSASAEGS